MSKTVEFYFDLGSPATYLAYTQLPKICEQTDSQLIYIPDPARRRLQSHR